MSRERCELPLSPEFKMLAKEIGRQVARALTPTYVVDITSKTPDGSIEVIDADYETSVNLWIVPGSAGVIQYMLVSDQGNSWHEEVIAASDVGVKIEGHFRLFGPNTTVYPLVGKGNLR